MSIEIAIVPDVGAAKSNKKVDRTAYLADLLALRPSGQPAWTTLRDQAAAIAAELAIPSTRDEDWRFTDLSELVAQSWSVADADIELHACDRLVIPEAPIRLVFLNGRYQSSASQVEGLPAGVFVGELSQLSALQIQQVQTYLGRQQGAAEVFTCLNTASLSDVAIVWVGANIDVMTPIHLAFITRTGGARAIVQPRVLVIAQNNASVTVVEEFTSADALTTYFTNAVTEIFVEAAARVEHVRLQWESAQAFHIGKTAVSQARDSRYIGTAIQFGSLMSRHNFEIYQTGEQTDTQMIGLTYVDGDRTSDTHSLLAFSQPYGTSNQLNKCIANDKGHAVFNGRINVPKLAQQTNAAQLSRNLLLSSKARIDTKPQLEIVANNVKCAHGATVSQLEDDEVFYLQSRGIGAEEARKLLTFAFANEVIEKISIESLRVVLADYMRRKNRA